jgi:hypothetical protein
MAQYVVTANAVVAGSGYSQPPRAVLKGQVLGLTAAEVTALNSAGAALRAVSAATMHDQLGEAFAVSNSD